MNKEDELIKKRIEDLARRCYTNNIYTFTDFLSLADISAFFEIESAVNYVDYKLWGGLEDCERQMVRFGSLSQLGFEEEFPIATIHVKPLMAKFSDDFSHRDILGALMNLGIERSTLGDITLSGNEAYVFCLTSMSEFICENLTRIKHTSVLARVTDELPRIEDAEKQEKSIQINSERIDGVIAKVYNLSRSQCAVLFTEKRIFVDSRQCENSSRQLKNGELITVRGYGRFRYMGTSGQSRKGKLKANIEL